ncbi:STM4504/CBY_0614 family protein [Aliivibrio fischeri]|uniref:Abortive infection protein-like C-terminal domain-containing protein n=1 Tax=Aliivibrio fischeri SR5 TaxID=1088719 RepID=A0AAV3ELT6_ALIFS|nr:hypothetical protein [Aliivibrio fischeri]EHN67916.1 hypothetical protein VFSR5_2782 [Aliivibrio fischeri SR5]
MPILELYSTRNKDIYPDVYQYAIASNKLRVQLVKIIFDAFGSREEFWSAGRRYHSAALIAFQEIFELMSKEYGEKHIQGCISGNHDWIERVFCNEYRIDRFLDLLEVLCTTLLTKVKQNPQRFIDQAGAKQGPLSAVNEINERMKRDGFGYEYIDGIIIKIDQDFVHAEVTKPALYLLSKFEGARLEFLSAHEHYRHSRYEECLNDCNKSLESLLKHICDNQSWAYGKGTVNALVPICMENGLFPKYLQTQLSSLSTLISQGVASIRNNESGHGQGSTLRELPEHLVSYTLHLTASNILFLGKSYEEYIKNQ